MKTPYLFIIIPFLLGISCFISFSIIGSRVAPDGTLVEPFFLIPIGYLMLAISLVSGLLLGVIFLLKKINLKDQKN